jgi:sulfite reductase alpha subunit
MNAIQRSDMATIGTWRDNIRADDELARTGSGLPSTA